MPTCAQNGRAGGSHTAPHLREPQFAELAIACRPDSRRNIPFSTLKNDPHSYLLPPSSLLSVSAHGAAESERKRGRERCWRAEPGEGQCARTQEKAG